MAFRWRAFNGPLIMVFESFLPSNKKKQIKNVVKVGPPLDPRMTNMHSEKNTGDPLTCDVPLSWHLHVKTESCQISSFDTNECFECDSSSNMCFGCSKEPSHRNGETVLLSTQDKCLLRNQVICQLRILIIWRSDNLQWRYCNGDSSEPFVVVLRSTLFKILKYF